MVTRATAVPKEGFQRRAKQRRFEWRRWRESRRVREILTEAKGGEGVI